MVLLVLTPLPYATVEAWSTTLWEVWVCATALLWVVLIFRDGELKLEMNPLLLPMLGLLLVAVIQMVPFGSSARPAITFDSYLTSQAATKLLASILFFAMFATFVDTDERRRVAVRVILGMCIVIALIGVGQNFIGRALWQRGTFGPFVNRNHFAGFLEMGVGLASAAIIVRSTRVEMIAFYACAVLIMCAGLVLSASRGGLLALAAEFVFLALIALTARGERKEDGSRIKNLIRAGGVIGLGAAALLAATLIVGTERLAANIRQEQDTVTAEILNNERFSRRDIWAATIDMIKVHPVIGVGLGAYQVAYTRYDPSAGTQRVEQSHNDYLQVLADAGIVGLLLAVLFVVLLMKRGLRASQAQDRQRRAIALGALTGCFAIVIHSFVDFNLQITANAQLFLALAALATPSRERGERRVRKKRSQSRELMPSSPSALPTEDASEEEPHSPGVLRNTTG
ncbi:MAG: O-antigen ligase family protein [Acidobacteriota bacterium]